MFVGLSKRLKSMGGFRLGVGLRLTKSNCLYFLFVLLFVGCFYLCWYSVLACGWILYFLLYGLYKIYYLMFKYGAMRGFLLSAAPLRRVRTPHKCG